MTTRHRDISREPSSQTACQKLNSVKSVKVEKHFTTETKSHGEVQPDALRVSVTPW
jgi:hypothetical protein